MLNFYQKCLNLISSHYVNATYCRIVRRKLHKSANKLQRTLTCLFTRECACLLIRFSVCVLTEFLPVDIFLDEYRTQPEVNVDNILLSWDKCSGN